jgi:hypothetical protein
MAKACKPVKPLSKRSLKKDIDINTTKRYIDNYYKKLAYTAGLLSNGNAEFLKMRQMLDTALHDMINVEVNHVGRSDFFASWLAGVVGWRKEILGNSFSLGGSVNERLLRSTNAAYNTLTVWVQSYAQPLVIRHKEYLREVLPNLSTKEVEILLHDSAIVGGTEEMIEALSDSDGAVQHLNKRLTKFFEDLQAKGLTDDQIVRIYENGKEYSNVYKQGQAYIQSVGGDISRLHGYVPIVFDKRIKDAVSTRFESFAALINNTFIATGQEIVGSSTSKARLDYIDYVINDVDITFAKFEKIIPGLTKEQVISWATDADKFKLEVLDKLLTNDISDLLEEGVLSRIPSMHSTIVDLLVRKEGLPIGLAEEVLLTDPKLALEQWGSSLERITKESFAFNDLMGNGIEQGWVVGAEIANQFPKQFIPLSSIPAVTKLFPGTIGIAVGQQYVHKIVARQLAAVLELNTNPVSASILGIALDKFGQFTNYFGKGLIANTVSAIAQYTQNFTQVISAVGSPVYMPKATHDVFKVLGGGIEALGTEKYIKFGEDTLSEQELFTQLLLTRGSTSLNEVTGVGKLSLENLKQIFRYDVKAAVKRGLINARYAPAQTLQDIPANIVNTLFKPVAFSNFISDISARYAIVLTLNNPTTRAVDFALGGTKWTSPKSVREALEYADEYIGFMDAKSELLGVASRYIRPFASYIMNYPGQVVRHAMRHPRRFYNAMKYYHHVSISEDREGNGYDKASWQRNKMLVPMWEDKRTKQKVFFDPSTVVGEFSTLNLLEQTMNNLERFRGGTTSDKIADLKAKTNPAGAFTDFVGGFFEGNYTETILDALKGADSFTGGTPSAESGFKTTTLFNIEMSKQFKAIVLLAAPFANSIDRSLPPEITGKRELRTPDGSTVLEAGVPGIFGNVPESGGYQGNPTINAGLGAVGLRPVYADTAMAIVNNVNELDSVISEGTRVQRYLISKNKQGTKEFEQVTKAIYDAKLLKIDVDRYAIDNGVTPSFAIKMIKQNLNKPSGEALKIINQNPGAQF